MKHNTNFSGLSGYVLYRCLFFTIQYGENSMKSLCGLLVLLVAAFLLSTSPASAWYRLVAKNGGPNGYNFSSYQYDEWGTSIWCEGAGCEKLPTEAMRHSIFKKGIDTYDQEAADFAFHQMRNGNKEGMVKMKSGRVVTWKRTSKEIYVTVF